MKLIIDNENKKLSRNRERRNGCRNKINNDMKLLLNRFKTEKKKKNEDIKKIKQLGFLLVRVKYADKLDKLESALKELKKIQVKDRKLHEIKQEILQDYNGEFEKVGNLKVGDQIRQTHGRCRNVADYKSYIIPIDQDYESEDAIFNGYIYRIDTPQLSKVNRSQY